MKKIALFGAGYIGKAAAEHYIINCKRKVEFFIDNSKEIQGTKVCGIPVISIDEFIIKKDDFELILSCNEKNRLEIEKQLAKYNIKNYSVFAPIKKMLLSYSHPHDKEDLILYSVLKDFEKDIFYIDVGANHPEIYSVTKLLYDELNANGINIEPQKDLFELYKKNRTRDINLSCGVGDKNEKRNLFIQGGLSTVVAENSNSIHTEQIEIRTLKSICDEFLDKNKNISFLKIDVEGFEKEVLMGCDFNIYRPNIIVMESTLPATEIWCYEDWEYILLENNYHFVYSYGVNRYYVANERREFDTMFSNINLNLLTDYYKVFYISPLLII